MNSTSESKPSAKPKAKTTALVKTKKAETPLELSEQDSATYAVCLALSRSSAIPLAYIGKPDQIFSTVVYGREFGLGPMTSLNNISNIEGRPSMSTHLMLGLCMRHKDFSGWEVKESSEVSCTVVIYRWFEKLKKSLSYSSTFTLDDAKAAGLMRPGGAWFKYRRQMLKVRAIAFACRDAFDDVLTGVYSMEEMDPERYIETELESDMRSVNSMAEAEAEDAPPKRRRP